MERGARMMFLKACTRCGGDLYLERDGWGAYLHCLQCGRTNNIPDKWLRTADDSESRTAVVATGLRAA